LRIKTTRCALRRPSHHPDAAGAGGAAPVAEPLELVEDLVAARFPDRRKRCLLRREQAGLGERAEQVDVGCAPNSQLAPADSAGIFWK
jgi:hypothetical protein